MISSTPATARTPRWVVRAATTSSAARPIHRRIFSSVTTARSFWPTDPPMPMTSSQPTPTTAGGGAAQARSASSQLTLITTTDPTLGASDVIVAGAGNDVIMGGTAAENIHGGDGRDLIFGDHGKVDYTLPANANFISVDTGAADGGGNDVIFGDAGDDTALGGQ